MQGKYDLKIGQWSLVIICFTVFIIIAKNNNVELKELLPQLSIVFLALIKLLPAVTKILFQAQKLKFAEKGAFKISEDLKIAREINNKENLIKKINFRESIEFKDIKFSYKNRQKVIFDKLNFKINKNDYVGIYGPSGGGKTSLVGLLSGFYTPDKGKILIDGKEVNNLKQSDWLTKISYLTQENNLIDETILRNVTFEFDDNKIDFDLFEEVCKKSGLEKLILKLQEGYNTKIGQKGITISGGERQRIGIARSLYAKKEILIFDESTSNLDD